MSEPKQFKKTITLAITGASGPSLVLLARSMVYVC